MASADAQQGDDDEPPGGEREWRFRDGALVVKTYEDFVDAAIGGVVTTASVDLARYVAEAAPSGYWQGRQCVELGSGCGLVSSTLLRLGASVTATELEAFLPHLRWNLQINSGELEEPRQEPKVEDLDWGDPAARLRLRERLGAAGASAVVGANCVYDPSTVPIFLDTVQALSGPSTLAFMCGVPVPRSAASSTAPGTLSERGTILDAFLEGAQKVFDCYLIEGACGVRSAEVSPPPATPAGPGIAEVIAAANGVTVRELADGIWLMLPEHVPPPAWVKTRLKVEKVR